MCICGVRHRGYNRCGVVYDLSLHGASCLAPSEPMALQRAIEHMDVTIDTCDHRVAHVQQNLYDLEACLNCVA